MFKQHMTIKGNFEDALLIHQYKVLFRIYQKCEVHNGGERKYSDLSVIKVQVSLWKEWQTLSNTNNSWTT